MKPINIKPSTYNDFDTENNDKDPKFQVIDYVIISKHRNIFAKGCTQNLSEEVSEIKKAKNTVPWTHMIKDLNGEEIIGTFYEKRIANDKSNRI